ncbi:TetR/AcrR family transcriptional regulator [Streptomyces sp. NPDC002276]
MRERKKQRTREQLARVSMRLFVERGFEDVTVSEIAEAVGVSPMTVFNYFPLKEDLVFDPYEPRIDSLARAVRERAAGQSALGGLREAYLTALGDGGDTVLTGREPPRFARLVRDSPRLRAREREIGDQREDALATELATATGTPPGGLAARLAAAQLSTAHRVLISLMRSWVLGGASAAETERRAAAAATEAFGALETVLGNYAVRDR